MRKTFFGSAFLTLCCATSTHGATWYVSASLPSSGDGRSWEAAFKTIQEGIDAATHGDTVTVACGLYKESIRFKGKNIRLTSIDPFNSRVIAGTIITGSGRAVTFDGTEDETCTFSGFTITESGEAYGGAIASRLEPTHATIEHNTITRSFAQAEGGAIAFCDGVIRNNVVVRNRANFAGAGLAYCDGVIENNIIADNCVGVWCYWSEGGTFPAGVVGHLQEYPEIWSGAGLYRCNGIIRNNIIVRNRATEYNWGVGWAVGCGGGLAECNGMIEANVIWGNVAEKGEGGGLYNCLGTIRNCVIWGNSAGDGDQLWGSRTPAYSCIEDWPGGEGNINLEPRFVDAEKRDFRLRADSPCIDAGFNGPELPEFDIAGMHRIMFGGKSLTVDMGAYEFYINKLEPVFGTNETIFTWSSLADKTYSIFYSDDLFNWQTAIENFPSFGSQTTSWTDDGSSTGVPPSLVPHRFYRLLENP